MIPVMLLAAAVATDAPATNSRAELLAKRGMALFKAGNYEQAERSLARAAVLLTNREQRAQRMRVTGKRGESLLLAGRPVEALPLLEEAEGLAEKLRQRDARFRYGHLGGRTLLAMGKEEEAAKRMTEIWNRGVPSTHMEIDLLEDVASIYSAMRSRRAFAWYDELENRLSQGEGMERDLFRARLDRGKLLVARNSLADAKELFGKIVQEIDESEAADIAELRAAAILWQAWVAYALDEEPPGAEVYQAAPVVRRHRHRDAASRFDEVVARMREKEGRIAAALAHYHNAVAHAEAAGDTEWADRMRAAAQRLARAWEERQLAATAAPTNAP